MSNAKQLEDLKAGWAALAAGEMDKLASFYAEDMIFALPGQNDVLEGRPAFMPANIFECAVQGSDAVGNADQERMQRQGEDPAVFRPLAV